MARCGHAQPRAPRRAGGRLPRRPRRARPARRRSGPGRAARRVGPRARRRDRRGRGPRAARGHRCEPATGLSPDDARALGAMRAGIETAFGRDAELPVAPPSSEPRATTPRRGPRPSRPAGRPSGSVSRAATGRSRTTSRSTASAWPARRSWPDWRPSPMRRGDDACSWASSRCGGGSTATVSRSPGQAWPIGHRPTRRCSGNHEVAGPPATPPSPPTSGRSGWPRATSSGGPSPPSRRGATR